MKNFTVDLENLTEQEREQFLKLVNKSNGVTNEGLELLKTPLPKNPCSTCGMGIACCGCPKGREYDKRVKPYKELGVYDIALSLRHIADLEREIKEKQNEVDDIKNNLPEEVKDAFYPSCCSDIKDLSGMVERGY